MSRKCARCGADEDRTTSLKAYWCCYDGEEFGEYLHGETRGEAKVRFHRDFDTADFVDVRVRRVPALDDQPFTFAALAAAGLGYLNEDGTPMSEEEFYNCCWCAVCRGEK